MQVQKGSQSSGSTTQVISPSGSSSQVVGTAPPSSTQSFTPFSGIGQTLMGAVSTILPGSSTTSSISSSSIDPYAQAIRNPPKTLQEIDDLIFNIFPSGGNGTGRLNTKANSSALTKNTFYTGAFDKNGFESVETSCNQYDCLIHSFLTAVSPNFRKLTQTERNTFADNFRRRILPKLGEFSSASIVDMLQRTPKTHRSNAFLSDQIGGLLGSVYGVNIVYLDKSGLHKNTYGTTPAQQQMLVGAFTKPGLRYIFVYNPDQAHYRVVRRKADNTYFFSEAEGQAIIQQMTSAAAPVPLTDEQALRAAGFTTANLGTLKSLSADLGMVRLYVNSGYDKYQILSLLTPGGGARRNRSRSNRSRSNRSRSNRSRSNRKRTYRRRR